MTARDARTLQFKQWFLLYIGNKITIREISKRVVTGGIREQFPPNLFMLPQILLWPEKFVLNI